MLIVTWGRSWDNLSARNCCTFDQAGQVVVVRAAPPAPRQIGCRRTWSDNRKKHHHSSQRWSHLNCATKIMHMHFKTASVLLQNCKCPISKPQASYFRFQINCRNCLWSFMYKCTINYMKKALLHGHLCCTDFNFSYLKICCEVGARAW